MRDADEGSELTDAAARRIAEQIVREVHQAPDPDNRDASSPRLGSQASGDADEDRIERALIEMGAVPPEVTEVGSHDGEASDAEPPSRGGADGP